MIKVLLYCMHMSCCALYLLPVYICTTITPHDSGIKKRICKEKHINFLSVYAIVSVKKVLVSCDLLFNRFLRWPSNWPCPLSNDV